MSYESDAPPSQNPSSPSQKRFSMNRPVEQDLARNFPTPPVPEKTPRSYKFLKMLLISGAVFVVGTILVTRTPLLARLSSLRAGDKANQDMGEMARLAIVNSPRLSRALKSRYEERYQTAVYTSDASDRLYELNSIVDALIPEDYVAAVYMNYYVYQQKELGVDAFRSMRDRQLSLMLGDDLLKESEIATVPLVKHTLYEQALYAFARSDVERALKLFQEMPASRQHSAIRSKLVTQLLQNPQNVEKTLTFARGIQGEPDRSSALYSIFEVLLKTDPKRASAIVPEIKEVEYSGLHTLALQVLMNANRAALATAEPEKALEEIRRRTPPPNLGEALVDLGKLMSPKWDVDRILSLAQTLPKAEERDHFLTGVIWGYETQESITPDAVNARAGMPLANTVPRVPLASALRAFKIIPQVHDVKRKAGLYARVIQTMNEEEREKMLPQVFALKEEPLASLTRIAIVKGSDSFQMIPFAQPYSLRTVRDAEIAFQLAKEIKDTKERSAALRQVALYWKMKDAEKGKEVAQSIPLEDIKAKTLDSLSRIPKRLP
jgi:hypothetical protein